MTQIIDRENGTPPGNDGSVVEAEAEAACKAFVQNLQFKFNDAQKGSENSLATDDDVHPPRGICLSSSRYYLLAQKF